MATSAARADSWPEFSLLSAKALGPYPQSCSPGSQAPACVVRGSSFPGAVLGIPPSLFSSGSCQSVPLASQGFLDCGPALECIDFLPSLVPLPKYMRSCSVAFSKSLLKMLSRTDPTADRSCCHSPHYQHPCRVQLISPDPL